MVKVVITTMTRDPRVAADDKLRLSHAEGNGKALRRAVVRCDYVLKTQKTLLR